MLETFHVKFLAVLLLFFFPLAKMCALAVKAILTDIEGTTTSISFVKDVLFPYAKQYTMKYLQRTWNTEETQNIVHDLIQLKEHEKYLEELNVTEEQICPETVAKFINVLIEKDLKLGPLKSLQGLVWAEGYKAGVLKGHVYPDVPFAFKCWYDANICLAIYSSGSIKAQKLLFNQTEYGDLLPYISKHFDTTSGHKHQVESYKNIARDMDYDISDILFLTDVIKEAEAARLAGMQVVVLSRPGNARLSERDKSQFLVVNDFNALKIVAK
uniref:Enolase-phosphatase E1 n=1 Tax=Glossina palpalis gambiensis TaxID=67801 RepID=A0A1B0BMQ8_9MUSC